jgi:hypothetical protein
MTIKQYFPLSVVIFLAAVVGIHYLPAPVAPFALIVLAGETLVGFELEDHKVPKLIAGFFDSLKSDNQKNNLRPN